MKDRRGRFRGQLAVDTGGWLVSNPRFQSDKPGQTEARAVAFLKSFRLMRYAAVNIGAHEMVLPHKRLKALARRHKVQLVSSNIVDRETEKPIFQPAVLKTISGVRFGVLGLISENPQNFGKLFAEKGLTVSSAVDAARAAVKVLRRNGAQVIVCLSALRRNEVDLVSEKVPGVDVFVGSSGMELTLHLSRLSNGYFVDTYTKGKYVGELLFEPGKERSKWAAADMRGSLTQQVTDLRLQVRGIQHQLKNANQKDSPIQLTEQSREVLQQQLVQRRAKLQRVTMELEDFKESPAGAGRMKMRMLPLNKEIKDEHKVLKAVDAYKAKYPTKPGH
ncbi:MAG TPA: hypothetical protein DCQ06_02645 [Myxococcales bacterium]|nr:hypothetical protein [Myxococcales bacterium]HAN30473.1 hypothetical protein [Myxococcales bacterium]